MSYEPRGLPLKALQAVQAHGPMFSGELADKIGCDTVDLYQCTQTLVKHGLLVREKQLLASGAVNRYSLGNGVPLPDPCALDPESKPVQIITTIRPGPATAVEAAPCPAPEPEPAETAVDPQPVADPSFAVGIFSDGRLVLEFGPQSIILKPHHAKTLRAFLESVPEVSA